MILTGSCLWHTVADDSQVRRLFSPGRMRVPKGLYGPQVYRFLFSDHSGNPKTSYIGETSDFRERLGEYRQGKKATERKLRGRLKADGLKEKIELQFLYFEHVTMEMALVSQDIRNVHARHLLESWAILNDKKAKLRLLNSQRGSIVIGLNGRIVRQPSRAEFYRELDLLDGKTK